MNIGLDICLLSVARSLHFGTLKYRKQFQNFKIKDWLAVTIYNISIIFIYKMNGSRQ